MRKQADEQWREQRACRDVDTDVFFPTMAAGAERQEAIKVALSFCQSCPVVEECLNMAMQTDGAVPEGVFGDKTAQQRREMRGSWRAAGKIMRLCPECREEFPVTRNAETTCGEKCKRAWSQRLQAAARRAA